MSSQKESHETHAGMGYRERVEKGHENARADFDEMLEVFGENADPKRVEEEYSEMMKTIKAKKEVRQP